MRFADPHVCPSCAGVIAGENRCPHCAFNLSSPASLRLWQTLVQADALLAEARSGSWAASAAETTTPPLPVPGPRVAAAAVPRTPRWSTGSIILGLGALCLLVAALVFITVSWDVLGPTGRTVVLLVITAAVAAAAAWSTRGKLRASAETLWSVFFGFFAIDFFAARAYRLLGLDAFSGEQAALLFGVLAAVLGACVVLASRPTLTVIVPSLAGGLAVWTASFSLAATVNGTFFWSALAGLALAAVAAATARLLALTLIMRIAAAATALLYLIAVVGAIDEMAESPHLGELARDGHGVPMLVMIALTAALGFASPRLTIPAAALVTLGASALVFTPAEAASPHEGGFLAASALAVVLAFSLLHGANAWARGVRIGAAAILAALVAVSLGWVGNAVDAVGQSNDRGFGTSWTVRLANSDALPAPGWVAFVAFGAIAAVTVAVFRWPEIRPLDTRPCAPLPPVVAGLGLVLGVIAYEPPVVVAAVVALALGIGLLVLVWNEHESWLWIALAATVIPAVMTLASEPVTLVVWLAVAATLATVAALFARVWPRRGSALVATVLLIGAATLGADLTELGDTGIQLVAVAASVLALALASFPLRGFVGRQGIELAGGLGIAVTLVAGVDGTSGSQALVWTVAGAALAVLGLLVADRRWLRYAGSAALGVAWVLRLLASDVDTIEAYTAPFGVVLLGAGLFAMRGNPQLRTAVALTPGLTLALVPSIPQALDDPAGLRALLLGLAALGALGIGIWRSWKMPVGFGAVVLALLVGWNVGPLANGLPRWILIAVAGVILVGSGITWESRVRNAKSAAQYVRRLR